MVAILFFALAITSVMALEIPVPNPVPDQIEPDWVLIPDEDDNLHLINVESALSEPQPRFNALTGVIFELYTPENPRNRQILRINDVASVAQSNFNPNRPTRFVVHGFNSKGGLTNSFQDTYFNNGNNVNFIAVNWEAGSNTINYISARNRVNNVGPHLAAFIDFLVQLSHLRLTDVVLIGHSLGAHIVGIAGKHVRSGRLPKVIGLDPANPLFSMNRPAERIAVGDAESVEIIVTNGGGLGFSAPLGDATWYPNGGRSQPGCGLDLAGACAHSRAHEFYAESINTNVGFYSYNCASYDEIRRGRCTVVGDVKRMGGDVGTEGAASGVYFVETNNRAPFARGRTSA